MQCHEIEEMREFQGGDLPTASIAAGEMENPLYVEMGKRQVIFDAPSPYLIESEFLNFESKVSSLLIQMSHSQLPNSNKLIWLLLG